VRVWTVEMVNQERRSDVVSLCMVSERMLHIVTTTKDHRLVSIVAAKASASDGT
jgi:hypothetical protein